MATSLHFGCFELRTDARSLLRDGQPVRLGARAYDLLLALVDRRNGVVEFDELLDVVWPGLAVEENNLSVHVSTLRKILGPDAITTVRGRGYRFTATVQERAAGSNLEGGSACGARRPADLPLGSPLRPSVAVLPFAAPDVAMTTIGVGDVLADQLIRGLSFSPFLDIISRLSTTVFREPTCSLDRIATLLNAQFVVSGSCFRDGERLSVNVELADTRTQRVLWSRTIRDRLDAVLHTDSGLMGELAGGILRAIIAAEARQARQRPFPDLESYTLLLSAIDLLYRLSRKDFELSRRALETLCSRAPDHPLPLAWLARWYLFRCVQGWSENRDADGMRALELSQRALDIEPDSPLARTMLGTVLTCFGRDPDGAETHYAAAIRGNPNESLAWLQWGNSRGLAGDGQKALAYVERAIRISPFDPARHLYDSIAAGAALVAGHHARAVEAARQSLMQNDSHVSTHRVLAIALSVAGRLSEARSAVRRLLQLEPDLTVEGFIARSPSAVSGLAHRFGEALAEAGVPRTKENVPAARSGSDAA